MHLLFGEKVGRFSFFAMFGWCVCCWISSKVCFCSYSFFFSWMVLPQELWKYFFVWVYSCLLDLWPNSLYIRGSILYCQKRDRFNQIYLIYLLVTWWASDWLTGVRSSDCSYWICLVLLIITIIIFVYKANTVGFQKLAKICSNIFLFWQYLIL